MSPEIIFALGAGVTALIYGLISIKWIMDKPIGNERVQEIGQAIQEGAKAYLNRQYSAIAVVGVVLFAAIWVFLDTQTAVGFATGAVLSALAGYIGMNVSVRSNTRTATAAADGINAAFQVAFRGGAITGLLEFRLLLYRRCRHLRQHLW